MAYLTCRESFIDDAKNAVGGAYNTVRNTIQRNVGNIANGINTFTNTTKNLASNIAGGIDNFQNKVSDFASNVVGSKNVEKKPVNQMGRVAPRRPSRGYIQQ